MDSQRAFAMAYALFWCDKKPSLQCSIASAPAPLCGRQPHEPPAHSLPCTPTATAVQHLHWASIAAIKTTVLAEIASCWELHPRDI
eukprot:1160056-Pelagomonas_calceolata.AAC.1